MIKHLLDYHLAIQLSSIHTIIFINIITLSNNLQYIILFQLWIIVFAVSTSFTKSLYSTYHRRYMMMDNIAQFMVSIQAMTYYPINAIARLNLYILSYLHVINNYDKIESAKLGKYQWYDGNNIYIDDCLIK